MLLLITGASGMGKTTVRKMVAAEFADRLESVELAEVAGPPEWSLRWRHQAVEKAVQRAVQAQRHGKHFLLCGDPVPPAEVYAAPSADQLESISVCLLDASEDSQRIRLMERGDDPSLIPHHIALAV
jgi:broad-specificity NMP kinase